MKKLFFVILVMALLILGNVPAISAQGLDALEAQPIEIVSLRTATSRTIQIDDNTYRLEASSEPIYYWDGNSYEPIDNRISNSIMDKDSYAFRVLQDAFNAGQIVEFAVGKDYVRFQPMALEWTNSLSQIEQISMPQPVAGVISNVDSASLAKEDKKLGTVRWDNAYGLGRDFQYTCDTGKLRKILEIELPLSKPQQYIIDGGNAALRLSFIFAPSDLDIYVDGKVWDESTRVTTMNDIAFVSGNRTLWYFLPVRYWDSTGEQFCGETELRRSGKGLYVSALVPYDWLQNAVYPIYIDPTISPYSSTADGFLYKRSATYSTVQSATSATVMETADNYIRIGQLYSDPWYYIYRSYFYFDTSTISSTSVIDSASLFLYGKSDHSDANFNIVVQSGQPTYPHNPLNGDDYDKTYYDSNGKGSAFGTASFTTSGYNEIELNGAGLGMITKEGTTKLCVRSEEDIDASAPTGYEYVDVYSADEAGTSKDPYLYVEYTTVPDMDTSACTDVTSTGFTANGEIVDDGGSTVTKRGFHYTTTFDDFEWGSDGDPLDDSGGAIDWTISTGGSSYAEIDDGRQYLGTRSGKLYYDGTNQVNLYGAMSPPIHEILHVMVYKENAARSGIYRGDGDHFLTVYWNSDEDLLYRDDTGTYDTGIDIPADTWFRFTADIDWSSNTYSIYIDGNLAQADIDLRTGTTTTDQVWFYNNAGSGSSVWLDEVASWDVEDEDGSFGEGTYGLSITGLDPATTYYIQAFGKNSAGYGYGDVVSQLTAPAAPTNIAATDGDYTDKVVITWTKSDGATGYKIYRDDALIDTLGDVATYDDTGADAPTITPGSAVASDGSSTAHVALSVEGESANVGTTHTYKVVAFNDGGDSPDSDTDTGYRGVGELSYQWYRSSGTGDSDFSVIGGGTTDPYNDTGAPAPTITPGNAIASDGSSTDYVALSINGESANVGESRYYYCTLSATGASSQSTTHDSGYRGVGELTYQWQRSSGDSDADYENISGATTESYNDEGAPAPTVTPGNAIASDGASTSYVILDLEGEQGNAGDGRYFRCILNADGATEQTTGSDRGYRGTGSLTYQWYRSAADSDDNYSIITGATSVPYHDTDGVIEPDGRYYCCQVDMAGAEAQNSTSDRGYKLAIVIPTVNASNATSITGSSAILHGEITDTGNENPDTIGFEWGYSSGNYTASWTDTGNFSVGSFTHTISGLPSNTQIFWRAFAINSAGQGNSTELDFATLALPLAPTDFVITQVGYNTYNISWTMGISADTTVIRASETGYPEDASDGYLVYSGNGTSVIITGVNPDMSTYYYAAWSHNIYGYSQDCAQAILGNPLGIPQILFAVGLCGFALWKKSWIRALLSACIIIWGVFAMPYDIKIATPLITVGTILFIMSILSIIKGERKWQY